MDVSGGRKGWGEWPWAAGGRLQLPPRLFGGSMSTRSAGHRPRQA